MMNVNIKHEKTHDRTYQLEPNRDANESLRASSVSAGSSICPGKWEFMYITAVMIK
jgi:hypothetical protein